MTDAQIMVKIGDEVLVFELDQPRHATSLQSMLFPSNKHRISKVGSLCTSLTPSERPCSSPGGGCIFAFATWFVFSNASYAPLLTSVHSLLPKIRKSEKILRSHSANFSSFFFNSPTMILVFYKLPTSRAAESLFNMAARMKREKFTRCI